MKKGREKRENLKESVGLCQSEKKKLRKMLSIKKKKSEILKGINLK